MSTRIGKQKTKVLCNVLFIQGVIKKLRLKLYTFKIKVSEIYAFQIKVELIFNLKYLLLIMNENRLNRIHSVCQTFLSCRINLNSVFSPALKLVMTKNNSYIIQLTLTYVSSSVIQFLITLGHYGFVFKTLTNFKSVIFLILKKQF